MQNTIMIILVILASIFLIYSIIRPVIRKNEDDASGCLGCSCTSSTCSLKKSD